jgi:hypothetical protein
MGGVNHQPCGSYFPESTELSKAISMSYATLELANVALEDLILNEVGGGNGSVEGITERLNQSQDNLGNARKILEKLRAKMDENNFIDLPTLRKTNLKSVGHDLAAKNLININAWQKVSSIMEKHGFYGMISHFDGHLKTLQDKTAQLNSAVRVLSEKATHGLVIRTLEENQPGNIKVEFADLYTSWAEFHQDFLASSILSTELWYIFRGYGSLSDAAAKLQAV